MESHERGGMWFWAFLVLITALSALLAAEFELILLQSAIGIIGLAMLAVAIPACRTLRILVVPIGLVILALGGWLDLEGWRFLAPRGPFNSLP